jgi:subfamily B ATP-binding cassette protein MsbA
MAWIGRHVIKDLRREMFDHLLRLPAEFYDRATSSRLISRLIYEVEQVSEASSKVLTALIQDTLTIIGLLIWMVYLNWQLTTVFLTVGPVMVLLVAYINKRLRRISKRLQNSVGDVTQISQETIDANRVVKIFGGQRYEKGRFESINENNRRQYMKIVVTNAASVPLVQFMAACLLAAIIYLATRPDSLETITVGVFVSFITAMSLLLPPLKRLTTITAPLQRGIAASQSIFGFLQEPVEKDTGEMDVETVRGEIEFSHVSFAYDEDKGNVLRDITLKVKPGETIAFVGRSGSGKTTLVSLLGRFYETEQGKITIDGLDIRDISLSSLRRNIAIVSQDINLFNDTIEHNIAYGRLDTADQKSIAAAAEAAHVMDFVNELPEGLNTTVGEDGTMLSGGQRQRLGIARAILKDAPILVLDEATSALDSESEKLIQQALDAVMQNRTTFVIAHRLSTIEKADKIVVLHHGEIVETGTHQQLLELDGHYAALYRMQFNND